MENWDKMATVVLAGWGAILSTILFFQDRPRIKAGIQQGTIIDLGNVKKDENVLRLSLRNFGRRPITVSSVEFITDQNKHESGLVFLKEHFYKYDLPKKLAENEEVTLVMKYDSIKSYCEKNNVNINYLAFKDTLDKTYKIKLSWRKWGDLKCNRKKGLALKVFDSIKFL